MRRDPGPESQGLEISRLESESACDERQAGIGWEKFARRILRKRRGEWREGRGEKRERKCDRS